MNSQHKRLIIHTKARRLSRKEMLCRVHELHKELHAFFKTEKYKRFCKFFQSKFWLLWLEYLAEIFAHLNSLDISMQDRENILTSIDKLVAFKKKVAL